LPASAETGRMAKYRQAAQESAGAARMLLASCAVAWEPDIRDTVDPWPSTAA